MSLDYEQLKSIGLPQIRGELRVGGLDNEVVIIRDRWGCPHLVALTTAMVPSPG